MKYKLNMIKMRYKLNQTNQTNEVFCEMFSVVCFVYYDTRKIYWYVFENTLQKQQKVKGTNNKMIFVQFFLIL